MKYVIYTSIVNGKDYLRPPETIDPDARYLAFVDRPMKRCAPWEFLPAFLPFTSGSRNSRLPKILPHLHFDAEYSVYHDGNFTLKRSVEYLITRYLAPKKRDVAMFVHPARQNVGQEAAEISAHPEWFPGMDMGLVDRQMRRWMAAGAPTGLWAAGMIIRKHTADVAAFNKLWWQEYFNGSPRDQLALPLARHLSGMRIEDIEGNIHSNDLIGYHWHGADWLDKEDNPARAAGQARYRERREELARLCGVPEHDWNLVPGHEDPTLRVCKRCGLHCRPDRLVPAECR